MLNFPNMPGVRLSMVAALLLVAFLIGCTPPPPDADAEHTPQLTKEIIDERINDARVFEVPPENGNGEPISWSFDFDEPKEVTVVEQDIQATRATIILDIKTQSAPRARNLRTLAGRLRTDWALKSGLVTRRWEIVSTDNISMTYKDLPKPDAPKSDR